MELAILRSYHSLLLLLAMKTDPDNEGCLLVMKGTILMIYLMGIQIRACIPSSVQVEFKYLQGSPFKFTHMLTLKQNQDYDKVASKHPEDKKCHFNVILE